MVEHVKQNQDFGVKYLKAIEYEEYIREKATREGLEQGLEQGIQQGEERYSKLVQQLIAEKRYEDLDRASREKEYRDMLFQEFHII